MKAQRHTISTFYSEEDGGYISTFPQIPSLSAFGETPEESITELNQAYLAAEEVAQEEGRPLPQPSNIDFLAKCSKFIKISALARESHLNEQTLLSKIKRGTQLAPSERTALKNTLEKSGIYIVEARTARP